MCLAWACPDLLIWPCEWSLRSTRNLALQNLRNANLCSVVMCVNKKLMPSPCGLILFSATSKLIGATPPTRAIPFPTIGLSCRLQGNIAWCNILSFVTISKRQLATLETLLWFGNNLLIYPPRMGITEIVEKQLFLKPNRTSKVTVLVWTIIAEKLDSQHWSLHLDFWEKIRIL